MLKKLYNNNKYDVLYTCAIQCHLYFFRWYKTALHFSGNLLKFFVNCELVESRQILVPDYCVNEESVTMTIGKDLKENYYNGSLQSVRVVASDSPLNKQCTDIEPTKGNGTMCKLTPFIFGYSSCHTLNKECNGQ